MTSIAGETGERICSLARQMLSTDPNDRPGAGTLLRDPLFAGRCGAAGGQRYKSPRHSSENSAELSILEQEVRRLRKRVAELTWENLVHKQHIHQLKSDSKV